MRSIVIVFLLLGLFGRLHAREFEKFDKYFEDASLRIDYIHSGDADSENIEIIEKRRSAGFSAKFSTSDMVFRKRISRI